MADGYARASGKVGVAIATSGPGATNMVTGIATAMMDSSPIVCITGQVGSKVIGSDAFQEIDITGITLPITKHNYLVTRAQDIAPAPDLVNRPLGAARAQVHETYIVAQTRDGIVIVDQHAAHERIVYERMKAALEQSGVARQILLIPEIVELAPADVERLLVVLHRLVDHGNTVIVIEHNLDVLKTADWLIDLGPEGGDKGGYVIAEGTPEELARNPASATGLYLGRLLDRAKRQRTPNRAPARARAKVAVG